MQICKFNITVSTQFLQLYYSLWCPGLQRLQRFDLLVLSLLISFLVVSDFFLIIKYGLVANC